MGQSVFTWDREFMGLVQLWLGHSLRKHSFFVLFWLFADQPTLQDSISAQLHSEQVGCWSLFTLRLNEAWSRAGAEVKLVLVRHRSRSVETAMAKPRRHRDQYTTWTTTSFIGHFQEIREASQEGEEERSMADPPVIQRQLLRRISWVL